MSIGISLPTIPAVLRASAEALAVRLWPDTIPVDPVDLTPPERETPPVPDAVLGIAGMVPTAAAMERDPEAAPEVGIQTLDIENDRLRTRLAQAEMAHGDTRGRLTATLEVLGVVSAKLADAQADALEQARTLEALANQLSQRDAATGAPSVVTALGSVARRLSWRP